jgi:hypothetical protein
MLLPLPSQVAAQISLANHLALAASKSSEGNAHLLNELLRAVYIGYFLEQASANDVPVELYRAAEVGLEEVLRTAHRENVWRVGEELGAVLERLLASYDLQLENAAAWLHVDARDRLERFIASDKQSPL